MRRMRAGIGDVFFTLNYAASYRALRAAAYGAHISDKASPSKEDDNRLRVVLSKMKSQGYLENKKGLWLVTQMGRKYFAKFTKKKETKGNARSVKNLIITFDIPEVLSQKRFWLRKELIDRGFILLQKSVWFGPGPLSKDFIRDLADAKILPCVKIFRAHPEEII